MRMLVIIVTLEVAEVVAESYFAAVIEEKADAVISITPFQELIVRREVQPEWGST